MTDLLSQHRGDDLVAFGEGGPKTAADLRADVARVAAAVGQPTPDAHVLLVVSEDRYAFAAALLGSWAAGFAVALPPNQRTGTVSTLLGRDDIAVLLHDTVAGGHTRVADVLAGPDAASVDLDVPARAATVFTSGTTGASEAWPKTSGQLLREVDVLARAFAFAPGGRFVVTVPPSHLYGLLFGVLVPLRTGGAFLRQTPLQPEAVAARVAEFSADTLVSVPVHLRAAQVLEAGRLRGVTRLFSSTAPLSEETARHFADVHALAVTEIFGSTETGGIASRRRDDGEAWTPLPGVLVDLGADGCLRVDSPFLHPDGPRPRVTADLAELCDGGGFLHRGRVDGVVKVGGVRVSLPAMQRWLLAQDGVDDAEVISVPAQGRGVRLLAAVASTRRGDAELRAGMCDAFHPSVVPRRISIADALPREPSGKLPRERLLQRFGLGPDGAPMVRELDLGEPKVSRDADAAQVCATVTVPANYAWFQGHFDAYPVLAGAVQLTELVLPLVRRVRPGLGHVRTLKRVKFTGRITPGDEITITVRFAGAESVCDFEIVGPKERCSAGRLSFVDP